MKICMHKDGCCSSTSNEVKHTHSHDHVNCSCHNAHEHETGNCCENNVSEMKTSQCECDSHANEDDSGDGEEDHCCGHNHQIIKDSKQIKNAKFKFKVSNLDCASCAMKVENAINKLDYVSEATLNFTTSTLLVNTKRNDTSKLLDDLNTVAQKSEDGVIIETYQRSEVNQTSHKKEVIQLVIAGVLFVCALLSGELNETLQTVLYVLTYIVAGYRVIFTAIRNIFKGDMFDENFLMSIATIGAFALGDFAEAVAVMLFYDVGELFQSIAVNRSRASIGELMDINANFAIVKRDGKEIQVTPEQLLVNDIVIVKAGERIPVDGTILEGSSSLDVSALTGESLPKDVTVSDEVLAGCLNVSGVFTMRVDKVASESTVARVLELVENAASKKAKVEKFITKFSKIYTPVIVLAAILLVMIPTLLFGMDSFTTWLYRGCTFLVISCPCALVVSIPLGLFAGIGGASKKGILVKGGNYLEQLSEIDTVVFDKTGTITKGMFSVQAIEGLDNTLELAAYGESRSNHPIALSILSSFNKEVDTSRLQNYYEIAGQGISAMLDGKKLLVGNATLLRENNIVFVESDSLGSIVYVAYDNTYIGFIVISDEIKKTSKSAIEKLKQLGVKKTVMLSGDKYAIAKKVAQEVGVDEVQAELLPQDKVSTLEKYLNSTDRVAFVGDGINDAPVLMRADLGIAMGGIGSDAAIEASDVVLMNDDLSLIPTAITIARKTKRILYQNIIFSLVVKVVVLALSAFGFVGMWMGVFADVGVTLIAIINAMRAMNSH